MTMDGTGTVYDFDDVYEPMIKRRFGGVDLEEQSGVWNHNKGMSRILGQIGGASRHLCEHSACRQ